MTAVADATARDTESIYRVVSGKALFKKCGPKDKPTPEDVADLVRTLRATVTEAKFVSRMVFAHCGPPPAISESGVRLGLLRSSPQSATTQRYAPMLTACRSEAEGSDITLKVNGWIVQTSSVLVELSWGWHGEGEELAFHTSRVACI